MKKRSLVSAIAMLVVSALVLTSATFAWFAAGSTATVTTISANVGTSDGSIVISADGGSTWKTTLTEADLRANAGNSFPEEIEGVKSLLPVSIAWGETAATGIVGGTLDGLNFTAGTAATGSYIKFTVKVKSVSADATVNVTPTFTQSQPYVYAAIVAGGAVKVSNTAAEDEAYVPYIGAAGTTATDTNNNQIIDDGEADASFLGTAVKSVASLDTTLDLVADTAQDVTIYMWAEGQDLACNGKTAAVPSIGLTFAK